MSLIVSPESGIQGWLGPSPAGGLTVRIAPLFLARPTGTRTQFWVDLPPAFEKTVDTVRVKIPDHPNEERQHQH
ncbi:MAG: hypothetical protein ACYDEV_07485 [Acidiferrobacter sp.]